MGCHSLSKVPKVWLRRESATNSPSIVKIALLKLSGKDASTKELTYKHSDGIIIIDISATKHEYYKEGTDAYKEALKKYNELQN